MQKKQTLKNIKVCFILLRAYAVFRPEIHERFGGAEVRLYQLARRLVGRGDMEVHVLCRDFGQDAHEVIEGVHLHRFRQGPAWLRKVPFVKNILSLFSMYGALKKIQPEAVVQFCAGVETGIAGCYARRYGAPLVFMVANDPDVDGRFIRESPWWLGRAYLYGLERAKRIVCQNADQEQALKQCYGRDCEILLNPVEVPEAYPKPTGQSILWVGRAVERKRPEWFLDLAESMPQEAFRMVLAQGPDQAYFEQIVRRAESIENLELATSVPFQEMDGHFAQARLFVSTSEHEGLPNTFLQAMSRGVPVISTGVDPNGMLSEGGAGRCVDHDAAALREGVEGFLTDHAAWEAASHAAWQYVDRHHEAGKVVARFATILRSVAED